ncbi:peptide chain release factor N(5)-glutamine methyltransferase [Sphingomonas sp.]|uniref:peptide chain release factor N(5)-glutamine methyltransferase n=1 Tax=Sphingomonas sp. TaxID=28214 RepID=UPI003B00BBDC
MADALAAVRAAAARLTESDTPRLDAELLMAHALGIAREALLLGPERVVPPGFDALVARREAGEPVAYIVRSRDFWDMTLGVTPDVLIPRPDSETLIEAAIDHFAGTPGPARVLDLGTGSGALLLAALRVWPDASGVGIDRSEAALAVAAVNAAALGLGARTAFLVGGWEGTGQQFDLLLCNPPYIATGEALPRDVAAFEPSGALWAGEDGLDAYRALAPSLASQLATGGAGFIEVGVGQAGDVVTILADSGLAASARSDLAGIARCLIVRR